MKKKTLAILGILLPIGALLLNSCGPETSIDSQDVALDDASKEWGLGAPEMYVYRPVGVVTEWGHCDDGWDYDGNGLKDAEDPACHMGFFGPIRDLSLYDFPVGHNYFPDISKDIPGGPGYAGRFRDPAMTARWLRFLTEANGEVAGIDLLSPGVNPEVVPFPEPLPFRVNQGTAAQGNNNNLNVAPLHDIYLDHSFLPPPAGTNLPLIPAVGTEAAVDAVSSMHQFQYYDTTRTYPEWGPKAFYNGGSQGAIKPARTGNPDAE